MSFRLPCTSLALALLGLSACALAGTVQPAGSPDLAAFPPLPQVRDSRALDPDYFPGTHLFDYQGNALQGQAGLELGRGDGQPGSAWGIFYREAGEDLAGLSFDALPLPGAGGFGPFWVGLSNYALGAWEWHGPYSVSHGDLPLATAQDYASAWGHTYIAVYAYGAGGCIVTNIGAAASSPADAPPPDAQALCVGPGKQYATIDDALSAAQDGDNIKIYAALSGDYISPQLFVTQANLSFWGIRDENNERPRLLGGGFNYTGAGSVPRAIFQFQPGADNCVVKGLELYEAHNDSYNGAGVRVNQAKNIVVEDCVIHGCDMGVMSNGDAAAGTGELRLVNCQLYANGNLGDPGYNHNTYAGGARFEMLGCEVYGSLTGHNVKSRAHVNEFRYCYVHDSANREFDLVDDAANTGLPGSYTIINGCIIEKAAGMDGNKSVIHFGQDGGNDHNGPLYIANCTIITPYISPVVQLSATNASVRFYNNIIWDAASGQSGQTLVAASGGADIARAAGGHNWLSAGFSLPPGSSFEAGSMYIAAGGENPPFLDSAGGDYRLPSTFASQITDAGLAAGLILPAPDDGLGGPLDILPTECYRPPFSNMHRRPQGAPDLGAYESGQAP